MRSDMAKVVTERPRHGMRIKAPKGYKKFFQDLAWEDQPKGEKIRQKWKSNWNDGKEFSERLGPLWKWLRSKVGQLWDDVYSEICQHLRQTSVIQSHVRDHINDFVETKVIIINGKPCHGEGYFYGRPIANYRDQLYVHPITNKLHLIKHRGKDSYKRNEPALFIRKNDLAVYKQIDGIWYEVKLKPYVKKQQTKSTLVRKSLLHYEAEIYPYDPILKKTIFGTRILREEYGGSLIGVSKQQLNSREIRRLKAA